MSTPRAMLVAIMLCLADAVVEQRVQHVQRVERASVIVSADAAVMRETNDDELTNAAVKRESEDARQACRNGFLQNPPENNRRYSSIWNNEPIGGTCARSMLNSAQAWCAARNTQGEWMQIDLGQQMLVSGVMTQGRVGSGRSHQHVGHFTVFYSSDHYQWSPIHYRGSHHWFQASADSRTVEADFPAVPARFVRLQAQTWYNHISMRAGVCAVAVQAPTTMNYGVQTASNGFGNGVQMASNGFGSGGSCSHANLAAVGLTHGSVVALHNTVYHRFIEMNSHSVGLSQPMHPHQKPPSWGHDEFKVVVVDGQVAFYNTEFTRFIDMMNVEAFTVYDAGQGQVAFYCNTNHQFIQMTNTGLTTAAGSTCHDTHVKFTVVNAATFSTSGWNFR